MAERRMFSKTITNSDAFLDMTITAQILYFHLSMNADDDGFINNPKSIIRNVRCSEDDLKILYLKKFIIPFESGIVVIKHWMINNYIQKDRYKETKYKDEKNSLDYDENKAYKLALDSCIQFGYNLDTQDVDTQVRLGKVRLGNIKDIGTLDEIENSENKNVSTEKPVQRTKFVKPTLSQLQEYSLSIKYNLDCQRFIDHYESNGWMVGRNKMKDWKATVRTWKNNEGGKKGESNRRNDKPTAGVDKYGNRII